VFQQRPGDQHPDAYSDPRFNPDFDRHTGYRTHSMLCMPIVARGERKIGVMQILNRKGGAFGSADERRLRAFSAQAAVAIENAQLFEDVTAERNYNEAILHSMNNAVLTLDAEGTLRKVNESARRILRRSDAELIGQRLDDIFIGRNNWVANSLEKVRTTGATDITVDTDLFIEGCETISVNLATVQLNNLRNESIGFMLMMEDITLREAPAQHHVALHEQGSGRPAAGERRGGTRRHRARRQRAVLRHPRLHLDLRAPRRQGNRGPAQRVFHRHGGHRVRPQRRARQVHRRHDHGRLRLGAAKRRGRQQRGDGRQSRC
jgi:PAS domain S-box-containing protein